ncbi:MAG: endonuclease/exonuclease/phosphatase family protein [Chloroflexota bacterium]
MNFRLLTYNILHGGKDREALLLSVLQKAEADVVVLQEVEQIEIVESFAQNLNMHLFIASDIALMSRYPIVEKYSYRSFPRIRDTVLEAAVTLPSGRLLHIFGVHPIPFPGSFLEGWRNRQLSNLRKHAAQYTAEPCLIAGDFNSIAPMDRVMTNGAPFIMRLMYWLQRGKIYRTAISNILKVGFTDCYRDLHPQDDGFTIPTRSPKVRLDYIFANSIMRPLLQHCAVVTDSSEVHLASDHYPVMAEFELVNG